MECGDKNQNFLDLRYKERFSRPPQSDNGRLLKDADRHIEKLFVTQVEGRIIDGLKTAAILPEFDLFRLCANKKEKRRVKDERFVYREISRLFA